MASFISRAQFLEGVHFVPMSRLDPCSVQFFKEFCCQANNLRSCQISQISMQ